MSTPTEGLERALEAANRRAAQLEHVLDRAIKLEAENAELRKAVKRWYDGAGVVGEAGVLWMEKAKALEEIVAELRKDRERLEWLALKGLAVRQEWDSFVVVNSFEQRVSREHADWRKAIDDAIAW